MDRTKEFNKTKIAEVTGSKSAVGAYIDSFDIERVKMRFQNFEGNKESVEIYVDFPEFLAICEQLRNRTLISELKSQPNGIAFATSNKNGFKNINIKLDAKGNIWMNANHSVDGTNKIVQVGGSYTKWLAMFMYVDIAIRSFLPEKFADIKKVADESYNANSAEDNGADSGYYPDPPSYDEFY